MVPLQLSFTFQFENGGCGDTELTLTYADIMHIHTRTQHSSTGLSQHSKQPSKYRQADKPINSTLSMYRQPRIRFRGANYVKATSIMSINYPNMIISQEGISIQPAVARQNEELKFQQCLRKVLQHEPEVPSSSRR